MKKQRDVKKIAATILVLVMVLALVISLISSAFVYY